MKSTRGYAPWEARGAALTLQGGARYVWEWHVCVTHIHVRLLGPRVRLALNLSLPVQASLRQDSKRAVMCSSNHLIGRPGPHFSQVPAHIKAALFAQLLSASEVHARRVALGSGVAVGDEVRRLSWACAGLSVCTMVCT